MSEITDRFLKELLRKQRAIINSKIEPMDPDDKNFLGALKERRAKAERKETFSHKKELAYKNKRLDQW